MADTKLASLPSVLPKKVDPFEPSVAAPVPFLGIMFGYLWRRRPQVPTARDVSGITIQAAVLMLRQVTGLTREELAKRMLITLLQLNNIESRGKPMKTEYARRLAAIAGDYGLAEMFINFDYRADVLQRKSRLGKAPEGSLDR